MQLIASICKREFTKLSRILNATQYSATMKILRPINCKAKTFNKKHCGVPYKTPSLVSSSGPTTYEPTNFT